MRINFIVLSLLALGGLIFVIGCSKKSVRQSSIDEVTETETDDSALAIYQTYLQLKRLTDDPRSVSPLVAVDCESYKKDITDGSIHEDARVHIYVNKIAEDVITKNLKIFPTGAAIVKEKLAFNGPSSYTALGIGGMIKRSPGYDVQNGDWEYFYADKTTDFTSGRIKNCAECHVDARDTDYVFSVWKIASTKKFKFLENESDVTLFFINWNQIALNKPIRTIDRNKPSQREQAEIDRGVGIKVASDTKAYKFFTWDEAEKYFPEKRDLIFVYTLVSDYEDELFGKLESKIQKAGFKKSIFHYSSGRWNGSIRVKEY